MKYLRLYNTLTREKQEVVPLAPQEPIRMYTCGPTVYDYAHIGNFRTYLFEDLLRRTLKYLGFSVIQVMNITDVDDKTIREAKKQKMSLLQYTAPFEKAFLEDIQKLGIEPAEYYPKATDYVKEMIQVILRLKEKGYAYIGKDESVYFSLAKFPSYGKLSHLKLEELKQGASQRVSTDEYNKDNISDFVLWKSYDPIRDGSIYWDSPFGKGRPGWHLECSTMAMKLLGETIDIHCGGVDNIFPHHENEIAQSEALCGKTFVRCWAHAEHLRVENKKMSKSIGNFYTLRDLLQKGYTPKEVRFMLIQTHYRTPLNFTFSELQAVKAALQRLQDFIYRLQTHKGKKGKSISSFLQKIQQEFDSSLQDDLNISKALAAMFDLVKEGNILLDQKELSGSGAQEILALLKKFDQVLGFLPWEEEDLPPEIMQIAEKREVARKGKNWKEADKLRDLILQRGYLLEDTPQGMRIKKKL